VPWREELAVLLDYDDENPYPLAIDIESEPEEIADGSIELTECPFDVYGLLGARESQLPNCGYREAMNQVAADTVYGFS